MGAGGMSDDFPHSDLRRARAAALSLIPTTTGAAKAIGLVLPSLKGKMDGIAVRCPTPNISLVDLTVLLNAEPSINEINAAMKNAAEDSLKNILAYTEEPLVSVDFRLNSHSSIFDGSWTSINGNVAKVLAWYDNEWAYSCRVVELAEKMADSL